MHNWMTGFTSGLMLGVAFFLKFLLAQRRRQQELLADLLQSGTYRVFKADGSTAAAPELLAALGHAPEQPLLGKGATRAVVAVALMTVLVGILSLVSR